MSPCLDNEFIEVAKIRQGSKKHSTLLFDLYPNLAHSPCQWSIIHLLDKIEKKNPCCDIIQGKKNININCVDVGYEKNSKF